MENDVKNKAVEFWQNRLAKFFPTLKGPTGCEIAMFEAGYEQGQKDTELVEQLLEENEKIKKALYAVWHEGVCAGDLKEKVEEALWQ
jgi:hypothetical protein